MAAADFDPKTRYPGAQGFQHGKVQIVRSRIGALLQSGWAAATGPTMSMRATRVPGQVRDPELKWHLRRAPGMSPIAASKTAATRLVKASLRRVKRLTPGKYDGG
jgi:hypothetical protein